MTNTSAFLQSIQFAFSMGTGRQRKRNGRRNGVEATLSHAVEVSEERCLLSGIGIFDAIPPRSPGANAGGNPGKMNPLTSIPVLNSRAGAPVTIYLDFDGHTESQDWPGARGDGQTGPVVTPVFDVDNDFTTFSDEELRMMEELWYRVAEDFMPFNVNVTTVNPGTFNNFEAILISIGGDGAWLGPAGGVAFLNAFNNSASNTCYVFTDNTGRGGADHMKGSALAASHEVGHTLGLNHNSVYDASGNITAQYDPGRPDLGPIMGAPYGSERETWSNSPDNNGPTSIQDDFLVMTRPANQTFRFRGDDHGDTRATATALVVNSPSVSARGVIGTNTDVDMFRFQTNSGNISFTVTGLDLQAIYPTIANVNRGTNLDAVLSLYDSNGVLVTQSNNPTTLDASINALVSAGTYYVAVSSTGQYGAIGQYTLTGTVVPLPTTPTMIAPTGTLTNAVPVFIWTFGANADHYELVVDNLTSGRVGYYTRDVVGLNHTAVSQFAEGDYQARVRTVAPDGTFSPWSNDVTFTVDILAPAKPRITRPFGDIADSFPTFGWTGDAASSTYDLWVSSVTNNKRMIYRTGFSGSSYVHFDALPDGAYRVWVRAFNTVGEFSPWSDLVEFSIDAPIPVAPTILAPTAVTTNPNSRILWTAVEGAAKYDLWLNNLSLGKAQYIRNTNISHNTPYFDPPALPQGSYVAWVRASNGNGEFSPWSESQSFSVDVLPPSVPKLTGPVGPNLSQAVTTTNPTFTWTSAQRAVKYDLWVNNVTTSQVQIIRQQNIVGNEYLALNNLPQGDYRAWVRGINSANEVGEWSTVFIFNLDEPTPSLPVITAPLPNPAGSVENPNPTFTWDVEFNAPFYEFRLDDVTLNRTSVISVSNINEKSYTIPNNQRLAEHTYVAMVRGINNSGEKSDWSTPYRVRIDVPNPTTPTVVGPSGTSKDTTPTFQWTHDKGTLRYEILVRDLERAETIVLQVTTIQLDPTGTVASYTVPDNKAFRPGTYRFWIRAFNYVGTPSSWSDARSFVISASLEIKDLKVVEPAKLEAAAERYASIEADTQDERQITGDGQAQVSSAGAIEFAVPHTTDVPMPVAAIEGVMESLSDPASAASNMLSASAFGNHSLDFKADQTSTAGATLLALAVMPIRRRRRKE